MRTIADGYVGPTNVTWTLGIEVRDIWCGVFWDRCMDDSLKVYICLLPMLPLLLHFPPRKDGTR